MNSSHLLKVQSCFSLQLMLNKHHQCDDGDHQRSVPTFSFKLIVRRCGDLKLLFPLSLFPFLRLLLKTNRKCKKDIENEGFFGLFVVFFPSIGDL